jgi:fatty acid desaturase/membrane-associated phospholipid phosphatase
MKTALFLGLGLWLTVPFFAVQYYPLFPAAAMPVTFLDEWIPTAQSAVCLYVSLYIQITLPLLLSRDSRELRHMCFGFGWIVLVSHSLFLFWPTAIPALLAGVSITDPLLRLVEKIETSRSACPSLHASLAVYCALCTARLLASGRSRNRLRIGLWIWTVLILASTLLSKQHVFLDIAAGAALGGLAYAALFRARPEEPSASPALEATLQARHQLACRLGAQLDGLSSQDWRRRAGELALFTGLCAAGMYFAPRGGLLTAAGIGLAALGLNAFVLLMHEGMHDCLFRGRLANQLGSVLLGATFLMSFSAYRVLHTRHHNYLGEARDPDDYRNYTGRRTLLWMLHFVRLACGSLLYLALIPMLALKYGSHAERRRILTEYAFMLVVYSVTLRLVPASLLLTAWWIPLLIAGNLTSIRGFAQHGVTDAADPYIASRTILPHPIVEFFVLHENYHLEHHLFPEVPSYHLPRLHGLVWPKLPRAVSGSGYMQFLGRFFRATARLDASPIGLERP